MYRIARLAGNEAHSYIPGTRTDPTGNAVQLPLGSSAMCQARVAATRRTGTVRKTMAQSDGKMRSTIRWAGLIGGPVLAVLSYAVLPQEYTDSAGQVVVFTSAGRITLGILIWMAVWRRCRP